MNGNDVDFKRLFEAAPALYMVLAADPPRFTIVAASDAYLRAVNKRRAELIGRPVFEALPVGPEDATSRINSTESFLRAIEGRHPDTMAVQRHDIERSAVEGGGFDVRYWSPVNTPVLDDDGKVLYVLHQVEDVTDYVQLKHRGDEQRALAATLRSRADEMEVEIYRRAQQIQATNRQLRDANERLGELDRAKTAFFSNISHELRTPLTLILGTLEQLLARKDLPHGALTGLTVAHRNGLRLLKLVNGLLEFSRIEAGRVHAHREPTDLGTLTAQLASSFESACEQAGLRLRIDCPPTPPIAVDRDMWERIVLNLLSNAFKHTWEGEIDVMLRHADGSATLSVRDTGTGIPADDLPHVFERFYRVAGGQGRSVEGSGIGLSLVQELARLHGGEVRATSEPGRGSTFSVILPAAALDAPDAMAASRPAQSTLPAQYAQEAKQWLQGRIASEVASSPATEPGKPSRPRVLLADDNADMRDYITSVLAPSFDVTAAEDGARALALARQQRPDLVLSDVMMPQLDGVGLLHALRADAALGTVPVILLSARAGEEAKGEGLAAGADDYLIKPFSAKELGARVASNLRLARLRNEVAQAGAREAALRDLDRRKNEFLAMLSHELRNPLAAIRNSVYILDKAQPGSAAAGQGQRVLERQVERLAHMIGELLDVSRITQGKMNIMRERVDLTALLREAADDARDSFAQKGTTLQVGLPRDPLVVSGDPTRLAQVVSNLLDNALKFTPGGGRVVLGLCADGADSLQITVRDSGAGMTADVLDQLFQPFVQADRTLDRSPGGLGLGLAIVKGLVEAHGGTVAAHSEGPGMGAKFTVRLPLAERARPQLRVVNDVGASEPRHRVLLIEDNLDAAETLKLALELDGHRVEVAPDGESGLHAARARPPDAIISDIGLPGLDGYGVAKAIRADPVLRDVCLVAITGYAALDDIARSRAAGFDHHLPKPPEIAQIEKILNSCVKTPAVESRA